MLTYHFNLENIHKHIILMWKTFTFNILSKKIHLKVKKIFNILNKNIMHIFLLFLDLGFVRLSIEGKGFIL